MNKKIGVILFFAVMMFVLQGAAQAKEVYWPKEFNQVPEVSWQRSAQSENFVIFWGAKGNYNFNTQSILNQLESYYDTYINRLQWLNGNSGNLGRYKIIVILNETWNTPDKWTGWAFGGNFDNVIGALFVHPNACVEPSATLAHEFAHSLQAQTGIEFPGFGMVGYEPAGFFWEAHAQFMAVQHYPALWETIHLMRDLNMRHLHYSSTRKHYGNALFLEHLRQNYGIELIHRLWREGRNGDHPLTTLKRLKGWSQSDLNTEFNLFARRNITFDYQAGYEIRRAVDKLGPGMKGRMFSMLEPMAQENTFKIPYYLAPQDYGYNVVQLQPDSLTASVNMTFWGNKNDPAGGAGHRFSFVAVDGLQARYSQVYSVNAGVEKQVSFKMRSNEEKLYLVVSAAPNQHHNYAWEPGWPKTYNYPWQIKITGAKPFLNNHEGVDGRIHANGGGFVANSAYVESGAYVGPNASVLGNARVYSGARIEGMAFVGENGVVNSGAVIKDAAIVAWGTVNGNARYEETAFALHTTGGSLVGGGDYEGVNNSNSGVYRQVAHPNNGRRDNDGLTSHWSNDNVNPFFPDHVFSSSTPPPAPPSQNNIALLATVKTSHVSPWETLEAVKNGKTPANSADKSSGAYGNWNGTGDYNQWDWVQYDFGKNYKINSTDIYWWNDGAGIATPTAANVEYWDGAKWVRIGDIGRRLNQWNSIAGGVQTRYLRVNMISGRATGVLEWRVFGEAADAPPPVVENLALTANVKTSHVSPWETLGAVKDGRTPANSADKSNGAYGNWNGSGDYNQWDWIQYDFGKTVQINSTDVYWWNDGGGILTPHSANVDYWDGAKWVRLSNIGTSANQWNTIGGGIQTSSLRVNMISNRATGILEWQVFGYPIQ